MPLPRDSSPSGVQMKTQAIVTYAVAIGFALFNLQAFGSESAAARKAKSRPDAQAKIEGLDGSGVTGSFTFSHAGAFVLIEGSVSGLAPGKHGFHVHEGTSCDKRGGHFNPSGVRHGSPDQPHDMRHVGDLGNLVVLESGTAQYERIDALARLAGPHSIVGRVLVVHQGEDDYVSQPSGNSGKEVGCGVIRAAGK